MLSIQLLLSIPLQSQIDDPARYNGYLLLGYAVMWLIALIYLLSVANRQRNLREDIQRMQRLLEEDEAGGDA